MTFKSKWADWKPENRAGYEPAKPAKHPFDPFAGSHVAHFPKNSSRGAASTKLKKSPLSVEDCVSLPSCSPGGRVILLQAPTGVPEEWTQGVADLLAMLVHRDWPEARWQTLREDALRFLRDWAAQAHALGWSARDIFGVHAEAPHARLDGMGLVPLLSGRPVAALTENSAAITVVSGGAQTYRRRVTWPAGCCLIWDLCSWSASVCV
jgi:hypothetical protein